MPEFTNQQQADSTIDTLERVKAKLLSGWAKRAYAQNKKGESVSASDPSACCWCLVGAIFCCTKPLESYSYGKLVTDVLQNYYGGQDLSLDLSLSLTTFNDMAGNVDEVIQLIDLTILMLKSGSLKPIEAHDANI